MLWYRRPAAEWVEALPVGNGRLGAMVFGSIERERLQLNEDTLWSGGPKDWNNPDALAVLPELRRLIAEGRYVEADEATKQMMGPYTQSYLPLGDLHILFDHGDIAGQDYHRELDLRTGIAAVRYDIGGVSYAREVFASSPDQVIAVRLTTDRPGSLSFHATLRSPLRYRTAADGAVLELRGRAPAHVDPSYYGDRPDPIVYEDDEGMTFESHVTAMTEDGDVSVAPDGVRVRDATEVLLLLSAATTSTGLTGRRPAKDGSPAPSRLTTSAAPPLGPIPRCGKPTSTTTAPSSTVWSLS